VKAGHIFIHIIRAKNVKKIGFIKNELVKLGEPFLFFKLALFS